MLIEQDKSNKHCTFLHAAMTVNSTKVLKIFLHDVCKEQCLLFLSLSNQAGPMCKIKFKWGSAF